MEQVHRPCTSSNASQVSQRKKTTFPSMLYPMHTRIQWRAFFVLLVAVCTFLFLSSSSTSYISTGNYESVFASITNRRVASKWRGYLTQRTVTVAPHPKLFFPRQCPNSKGTCAKLVPSFIIAGSELSGTGYIFNTLRSHPQVVGTVDHQDSSALFEVDDEALFEAYLDEFPLLQTDTQVDEEVVVGEHAPQYLYRSHVAARRLRELLPHVKLVFILRDPIDRAYSQYFSDADNATASFESLVETELDILRQCGHTTTGWGGFVRCHESNEIKIFREAAFDMTFQENRVGLDSLARGMYYSALLPFLDQFPTSQLLVMRTEDFLGNPSESFQRLARFLGINPTFFSKSSFYHNNRLAKSVLFGHDVMPPPIHFRDDSIRVRGKVSALAMEDRSVQEYLQMQPVLHTIPKWTHIPRLDLGTRYRLQKVFRQLNERLIELFEYGAEDFAGWEYDVEQG